MSSRSCRDHGGAGENPRYHFLFLDKRHVDDPALDRGHRLDLDDLAGLEDALRGAVRDVAQLLLAARAPNNLFPEGGLRPLVRARNSVKRSRMRTGTGQPSARKHEISALA